jgi:predicted CXXCH cytochrome family protein
MRWLCIIYGRKKAPVSSPTLRPTSRVGLESDFRNGATPLRKSVFLNCAKGLGALGLALAAFLIWIAGASAQGPTDNQSCLRCHSNPDLTMTLPNGEPLSLFVDSDVFHTSIHGTRDLQCVQCHTDIQGYPHPPSNYIDRRDVTLQNYRTCESCHPDNYRNTLDSMHQIALAGGNRNAAVCTDCHTAHAVNDPATPRTLIPQTCAQCHSTISDQYGKSVHGAALFNDSNPDVPTCIDCHGVHGIGDPTTARFRLNSPQICAKCHTDPAIMSKYGISTDVLNTYIADFHGTTVELFAKQHPDQPTNKPVCYDCHGVHDIKSTSDPASTVATQENLLETCRRCHPDATTASFTSAWMSHYQASPENYPLVYYINLFYWIIIPLTIGALLIYIASDVFHRVRRRWGRPKKIQNPE